MVILANRRQRSLARGVPVRTQTPPPVWLGQPFCHRCRRHPGSPPVSSDPFLSVQAVRPGRTLRAVSLRSPLGGWALPLGLAPSTRPVAPKSRSGAHAVDRSRTAGGIDEAFAPPSAPAVPSFRSLRQADASGGLVPPPAFPEGSTGRCGLPRLPRHGFDVGVDLGVVF
jgi:hypothetical protein